MLISNEGFKIKNLIHTLYMYVNNLSLLQSIRTLILEGGGRAWTMIVEYVLYLMNWYYKSSLIYLIQAS